MRSDRGGRVHPRGTTVAALPELAGVIEADVQRPFGVFRQSRPDSRRVLIGVGVLQGPVVREYARRTLTFYQRIRQFWPPMPSVRHIYVVRSFCCEFFPWYNQEHRHSGLALMTPESVHYGRAAALLEKRAEFLAGAYATHPERFVRGLPRPPQLPTAVWINRPATRKAAHELQPPAVSFDSTGSALDGASFTHGTTCRE